MHHIKQILVASLLIGVSAFSMLGCDSNDSTVNSQKSNAQVHNTQQAKKKSTVPIEYLNALKSAQMYSDHMHMSQLGLYEQLTSEYGEKFTPEAAAYALLHIKVDYKRNALETARNYQRMGMSRAAIYDQLISPYGERFKPEEAEYALQNLEQ